MSEIFTIMNIIQNFTGKCHIKHLNVVYHQLKQLNVSTNSTQTESLNDIIIEDSQSHCMEIDDYSESSSVSFEVDIRNDMTDSSSEISEVRGQKDKNETMIKKDMSNNYQPGFNDGDFIIEGSMDFQPTGFSDGDFHTINPSNIVWSVSDGKMIKNETLTELALTEKELAMIENLENA